MQVEVKIFDQMTLQELYQLLQLRAAVFVVEQDCVYQDVDGKDQEAIHLLGKIDGQIAAYTRIFKPGDYFKNASIGRVVVDKKYRGKALGQAIMTQSLDYCRQQQFDRITISAQCYLDTFYKDLGFSPTGSTYLEDGIPHQEMVIDL